MMAWIRRIITAAVVVLAVAAQTSVVSRWNLPGATPDLVLVVVIAFGMRHQPARASMLGFAAGLLLDATPPSVGLMGLSALTLTIVGYLAAQLRTDISRSPFGPLLFVAAAAIGSIVIRALLGSLLGDPEVALYRLPVVALATAVYSTLLGAVAIPIVRCLLSYLMPAPTEYVHR